MWAVAMVVVGCGHVRQRVTPWTGDTYLVTCDGYGYADTGDTMQCIADAANKSILRAN